VRRAAAALVALCVACSPRAAARNAEAGCGVALALVGAEDVRVVCPAVGDLAGLIAELEAADAEGRDALVRRGDTVVLVVPRASVRRVLDAVRSL